MRRFYAFCALVLGFCTMISVNHYKAAESSGSPEINVYRLQEDLESCKEDLGSLRQLFKDFSSEFSGVEQRLGRKLDSLTTYLKGLDIENPHSEIMSSPRRRVLLEKDSEEKSEGKRDESESDEGRSDASLDRDVWQVVYGGDEEEFKKQVEKIRDQHPKARIGLDLSYMKDFSPPNLQKILGLIGEENITDVFLPIEDDMNLGTKEVESTSLLSSEYRLGDPSEEFCKIFQSSNIKHIHFPFHMNRGALQNLIVALWEKEADVRFGEAGKTIIKKKWFNLGHATLGPKKSSSPELPKTLQKQLEDSKAFEDCRKILHKIIFLPESMFVSDKRPASISDELYVYHALYYKRPIIVDLPGVLSTPLEGKVSLMDAAKWQTSLAIAFDGTLDPITFEIEQDSGNFIRAPFPLILNLQRMFSNDDEWPGYVKELCGFVQGIFNQKLVKEEENKKVPAANDKVLKDKIRYIELNINRSRVSAKGYVGFTHLTEKHFEKFYIVYPGLLNSIFMQDLIREFYKKLEDEGYVGPSLGEFEAAVNKYLYQDSFNKISEFRGTGGEIEETSEPKDLPNIYYNFKKLILSTIWITPEWVYGNQISRPIRIAHEKFWRYKGKLPDVPDSVSYQLLDYSGDATDVIIYPANAGKYADELCERVTQMDKEEKVVIDFTDQSLTDNAASAVLNRLRRHGLLTRVHELNLSNNCIDGRNLKNWLDLLCAPSFKWLVLTENSIKPKSIEALKIRLLQEKEKTTKVLSKLLIDQLPEFAENDNYEKHRLEVSVRSYKQLEASRRGEERK